MMLKDPGASEDLVSTFDRIDPKTCAFKDCLIPLTGKDFVVGERYCRLHLEEGKGKDERAKKEAWNQKSMATFIVVGVMVLPGLPLCLNLIFQVLYALLFRAHEYLSWAVGSSTAATLLLLSASAYLIYRGVASVSGLLEQERLKKKASQEAKLKALESKDAKDVEEQETDKALKKLDSKAKTE